MVEEILSFKDKYISKAKADIDPNLAKDKIILSNDAFATAEQTAELKEEIKVLAFKIGRRR